jgi:arylsulfatase A-like enzyme
MLSVVLAFDRLPAGGLGCYGAGGRLTPAIDRIAAESLVFDRHYADDLSDSPADHAWWSGRPAFAGESSCRDADLFEACRRGGVTAELIADRAALAVVPPPRGESVSIIESNDAVDGVIAAGRRRIADTGPGERRLLWMLCSPEDTAGADNDPAAFARAIDAAAGLIWADLLAKLADAPCLFVLTAARGREPSVMASLRRPWAALSEPQAHVPLVVHDFGRTEPGRCPALSTSADLSATLRAWHAIPAASLPSGEPGLLTWTAGAWTAGGRPTPREAVGWMRKDHGWAIRTDEFLLITSPAEPANDTEDQHGSEHATPPARGDDRRGEANVEAHLFVKPDDRWDLHDVAAQEPEAVAKLREVAERWRA